MKKIVKKLIKLEKTVATMESCTGGGVANAITNIEGASSIIKYSAVTYSNEFKIKMGVDEKFIEKYSVYSMEVANEMSYSISSFANSNFGIGITGKLNRADENNKYGDDSTIYVSIYDKDKNKFYNKKLYAIKNNRKNNKELIIKEIENMLLEIL